MAVNFRSPTMIDATTQPIDDSAPGAAMDDSMPQTASFTPEQLTALGLEDCKPGDAYTITVKLSGDGENGDKSFDVVSTEPSEESSDYSPTDGPPIAGDGEDAAPGDESSAPIDEGAPDAEPDPQGQAEEKMLGFKRKKSKRALPFPGIDKLRS